MAIEILNAQTIPDILTGQPVHRHAEIVISDNGTAYLWRVGGLPLEGDLQAILDAREAELWAAASAAGEPVPIDITAGQGARAWYAANPNASLLFELPIEDLETEVTSLVNALFPTATAGNKTKMALLLVTLSVSVRVLAKREGFVD